jgi:hypothetical protein
MCHIRPNQIMTHITYIKNKIKWKKTNLRGLSSYLIWSAWGGWPIPINIGDVSATPMTIGNSSTTLKCQWVVSVTSHSFFSKEIHIHLMHALLIKVPQFMAVQLKTPQIMQAETCLAQPASNTPRITAYNHALVILYLDMATIFSPTAICCLILPTYIFYLIEHSSFHLLIVFFFSCILNISCIGTITNIYIVIFISEQIL